MIALVPVDASEVLEAFIQNNSLRALEIFLAQSLIVPWLNVTAFPFFVHRLFGHSPGLQALKW